MSWAYHNLGDLIDFRGGGTPSRGEEKYWNGSIPWATVKDFNDGYNITTTQEKITELGLAKSASNLIEKGTVIIPTRMALGKAAICNVDIAINQDLKACLIKSEYLDSRYLLWFFISNQQAILSMGKGATVKGVTLDQIRSLKIPLPPLDEQRRIAAILDKADELRQKRKQTIAKLDELVQATFIDMFGDPVTNPKGWEKIKLCFLTTKIGSGSTPKGGDSAYKENGIPLIRSLNVHDGHFKYKNLAFIDDDQASKLNNVIIKKGDVLLNITGASIARCCIVPDELEGARVNQHVSILRSNPKIVPEFLQTALVSTPLKNYLLNIGGSGATREALTKLQLQDLEIIVPPLEEQNKFIIRFHKMRNISQSNTLQLNQLESLFKSLQHQAFSGQLTPP